MKKLFSFLFFLVFLVCSAPAQDTQVSEAQKISQQIAAFYQQGRFDEAIPLAAKLVEMERNSPQKDLDKLGIALTNFAFLKKEKLRMNQEESLRRRSLDYLLPESPAGEVEALFREVIEIYQKKLKKDSSHLSVAMNELAWVLLNRSSSLDRLQDAQKRIDEAKDLYLQTLALREKMYGAEGVPTLGTVLQLAEFYEKQVDFENAILLFNRYITAVEKSFGKDHRSIIKPLRGLANISFAAGDEKELNDIAARISQITKAPENLPTQSYNLTPRATEVKFSINDPAKNQKYNILLLNAAKGLPYVFDDFTPKAALTGNNTLPNKYAADPSAPFIRPTSSGNTFTFWKISSALVQISVDEAGKVEKAVAYTPDKALKDDAENKVLKWRFKPFVYNGTAKKMKGWTVFYQVF